MDHETPDPGLPRPRRLARALVSATWGGDARYLVSDLGEEAAARMRAGRGGVRLWAWLWWQILRSLVHGLRSGGSRPPRAGPGRASSSGAGRRVRAGLAFRLALRGLRRDRSTSFTVVAMLALGVTAPAVFFSLLYGGGMRDLPVPDGERVVRIEVLHPPSGGAVRPTGRDLELLAGAASLSGIAGFAERPMTLSVDGWGTVDLAGAALTPGAMELLGIPPMLGGYPRVSEPRQLLLGHDVWLRLFDADRDIVGRPVTLSGEAAVVAGVMPEGYGFPTNHAAWTVLGPREHTDPLQLFGRLADGATGASAASTEITARWRQGDALRPDELRGASLRAIAYTAARGESGEAVIFFGLVVVGIALLIIAAVNAANLLMVRAVERVGSLGVQAALGAARVQIAVQLLLEAMLLSALGGALGLGLTHVVVRYIQATASGNFGYYWMHMAVELPVVAFVVLLVLGTALVSGLAPIRTVFRLDLQRVLKDGASGAPRESRWARAVTSAQLALSCGALAAAGLASQAIGSALDLGGDLPTREVVMAPLTLPGARADATSDAPSAAPPNDAFAALAEVIRSRPVDGRLALAWGAPGFREPFRAVELTDEPPPASPALVGVNAVGPAYFELFDVELLRGRLMGPADAADAVPVVVVNRAWVDRFAPAGAVLGREVRLPDVSDRPHRIVGVVETIDLGLGDEATNARVYLSIDQVETVPLMVLGRRPTDPGGLVVEIRRAVHDAAPDVAVGDAMTLEEGLRWMTRAQFTLSLLAAGGGYAGLGVAAVGLYALLAFRVRRRRRELGVRLAMGADGARLGREVVVYALRQIGPAMVVGLAVAWMAAPILSGILLGNGARSPMTFAGVALLFLGVCVGVSITPARSASRVAPATALRAGA